MSETLLTNLASIVLLVNIIVQITKDLKPIKKIPTQLYTIILSILINIFTTYSNQTMCPNPIIYINSILEGFIIAYICMYGYDTFYELKNKLGGR